MAEPIITKKEIAAFKKSIAEMRAGKKKPGGLTIFEKRKGKTISKRWRSADEMIIERELDEKTQKWTETAKYPGICFWCDAKKDWIIKKK